MYSRIDGREININEILSEKCVLEILYVMCDSVGVVCMWLCERAGWLMEAIESRDLWSLLCIWNWLMLQNIGTSWKRKIMSLTTYIRTIEIIRNIWTKNILLHFWEYVLFLSIL